MRDSRPIASVIVVADYGGRTAEDWNYLRHTLGGLSRQRLAGMAAAFAEARGGPERS